MRLVADRFGEIVVYDSFGHSISLTRPLNWEAMSADMRPLIDLKYITNDLLSITRQDQIQARYRNPNRCTGLLGHGTYYRINLICNFQRMTCSPEM